MDLNLLVTVCLKTFCYWWLVPTLTITSKDFASQLESAYVLKEVRIAHVTRRVAIKFLMIREAIILKAKLTKHIWTLWHISDSAVSTHFAQAVHAFNLSKTFGSTVIMCTNMAKCLDLQERGWAAALHILVRLAVLMRFFGMRDSMLYSAFMGRMDLVFNTLNRAQALHKKKAFSYYIDSICISKDCDAWIWNPSFRVITSKTFLEIQQVWWYGTRGTHQAALSLLPHILQTSVGVLAIFFKCGKAKTALSKQKLGACIEAYTNKL